MSYHTYLEGLHGTTTSILWCVGISVYFFFLGGEIIWLPSKHNTSRKGVNLQPSSLRTTWRSFFDIKDQHCELLSLNSYTVHLSTSHFPHSQPESPIIHQNGQRRCRNRHSSLGDERCLRFCYHLGHWPPSCEEGPVLASET